MKQKPFNKCVLRLLTVLISILGMACSRTDQRPEDEGVKASTTSKYTAALGTFQSLKGTPYLMSAITNAGSRSDEFSSHESYNGRGQTHNLVFLNANSLESHRLFNTNAYVIVQTDQYSQKLNNRDVTQWLGYQVVKTDTDGNKRLDQNDQRTLGISSASGQQYVEVLTGITELFGLTMVNPGKLVVVYRKNNAKTASVIDLDKRTSILTKAVTDLGAQVK